jgi:hypothetical protein
MFKKKLTWPYENTILVSLRNIWRQQEKVWASIASTSTPQFNKYKKFRKYQTEMMLQRRSQYMNTLIGGSEVMA